MNIDEIEDALNSPLLDSEIDQFEKFSYSVFELFRSHNIYELENPYGEFLSYHWIGAFRSGKNPDQAIADFFQCF